MGTKRLQDGKCVTLNVLLGRAMQETLEGERERSRRSLWSGRRDAGG